MYQPSTDAPFPADQAAWLLAELRRVADAGAQNNQVVNLQPQAALPPKLSAGNTFYATASLALPSGEGIYRMNAAGSLVFVG